MIKKTVFIAIAFGTSVRDVLRNDTYKLLLGREDLDIIILAQDINESFQNEFRYGKQVRFEKLSPVKPTLIERLLLHFHRASLRDRCRTIDLGNTSGDTSAIDKITPLARFTLKVFGETATNKLIFLLYKLFASRSDYKSLFDSYKPDLVVVTRVLNYSADYPVMRNAAKLKVPVVALVSSWDNLTSKAFFPFSLNKLVVWNEVLKAEAVDLFQFPADKIAVTGIPRYDVFFKKTNFRTKADFMSAWGLNPAHKIITYCTGSETTGKSILDPISPESNIAKYIGEHCAIGTYGNTSLIVRLHPQANVDHYKSLEGLENVLVNIPGKKGQFQDRVFSSNEDVEFGELMCYSDVVINFASTVTIDAAVFDTPIVCVNFDFNGERPYSISPRRIYDFDHYAKLRKVDGFALVEGKAEMDEAIVNYLKNPSDMKDGRRRIVDQQCVFTDGQSGARNASILLEELGLPNESPTVV